MSELHKALECLRPKEFEDIPTDNLKAFLPEILANAEIIANSVPPPPNGTPYESSKRTRTSPQPAINAADLTISNVRRPPPIQEHVVLQKSWGKPLKLGNKEAATGMSVFKMAGNDRHGAWFARTGVHEGLGFAKWKRAMLREFPESLEVKGGPGEGNVRGIGGDQKLEDINVDGIGRLEVYQLSAQFPGPTSPREFITLLITSDQCLTKASKIGDTIPRHYMVVSIPVSHPDAPARAGMVRGFYESIEMIREIPMPDGGDAETNPVEWIMVTRSDPGGGIPRFMVERNVPSSVVLDAVKFLDWACARDDLDPKEDQKSAVGNTNGDTQKNLDQLQQLSLAESNGITAGVGTSIADRPSNSLRRISQQSVDRADGTQEGSLITQFRDAVEAYVPEALNPLHRTYSSSSSSSSSSTDSFASAEQFTIAPTNAPEGLPIDNSIPTPSLSSEISLPIALDEDPRSKELAKIEEKKQIVQGRLDEAREKQDRKLETGSIKNQKDLDKATEKHQKELKKQETKFEKEIRKLEERREKETRKLLAKQQKEAAKNKLHQTQRELNELKQKMGLLEQENKILKEQIGELQRENTALVVRMGKSESGREMLKIVREVDLSGKGRIRSDSRASGSSGVSGKALVGGDVKTGTGAAAGRGG